jgi:hypothetical protein
LRFRSEFAGLMGLRRRFLLRQTPLQVVRIVSLYLIWV